MYSTNQPNESDGSCCRFGHSDQHGNRGALKDESNSVLHIFKSARLKVTVLGSAFYLKWSNELMNCSMESYIQVSQTQPFLAKVTVV